MKSHKMIQILHAIWNRRFILLCFTALYLGSYVTISRIGFRRMERMHGYGFHYVEPTNRVRKWCNVGCYLFYFPVYAIDNLLGTGRPIGTDEYGMRLSRGGKRGRESLSRPVRAD